MFCRIKIIKRRGNLAGVDGRLQTRNYDGQDGKRVYVTEVVAESVQFLEPRNNNEAGQTTGGQQFNIESQSQFGQQFNKKDDDSFSNHGQSIDISDDDLPF
ncbi:hypothetical protein FC700_20920 [Bacillus mycoides]|nr:hypothetical protein FC700_20920 [Bacillus mycoides]